MHSPTWFSSSVEFKTRDLEQAKNVGWHGWERERSDARRKRIRPKESLLTETVVALRPDQFLRYVEFERLASGLDCGERLVLSDRIERGLAAGDVHQAAVAEPHALELQLGLPANQILDVIERAFRLAAAVRGAWRSIISSNIYAGCLTWAAFGTLSKMGNPISELSTAVSVSSSNARTC